MEEDGDDFVVDQPPPPTEEELDRQDVGKCDHYRGRCKLRAPCCNEIFTATTRPSLCLLESECFDQSQGKQVVCAVCDTEQQQVAEICSECGVKFGEYFCEICRFYDDNRTKGQFHCDDCGICRVGGRENFFHCKKCGKASLPPCCLTTVVDFLVSKWIDFFFNFE